MAMPVPTKATGVIDIDGTGESKYRNPRNPPYTQNAQSKFTEFTEATSA